MAGSLLGAGNSTVNKADETQVQLNRVWRRIIAQSSGQESAVTVLITREAHLCFYLIVSLLTRQVSEILWEHCTPHRCPGRCEARVEAEELSF